MFVYRKVNGEASDLRLVPRGYQPASDEITGEGDTLPGLATLHDAAVGVSLARTRAAEVVDAAAEAARRRYVTPGSGQAMMYLMKAQQAQAFKDGGYAGAVPPLVQAAAAGRGLTPQQAADLILATQATWETVGAAIEQARESGKTQVTAAADAAAVAAARDTAVAALGAI